MKIFLEILFIPFKCKFCIKCLCFYVLVIQRTICLISEFAIMLSSLNKGIIIIIIIIIISIIIINIYIEKIVIRSLLQILNKRFQKRTFHSVFSNMH